MKNSLQEGKIYSRLIANNNYRSAMREFVFVLTAQPLKPIYMTYKFLVMSSNQIEKRIVDKFGHDEFLKDYVLVEDEQKAQEILAKQKEIRKE